MNRVPSSGCARRPVADVVPVTGRGAERVRGQRGVSLSVFITCLIPLLVVVVGLVVDGAARVDAARQVSVVAAQAARAGADASAADRLAGGSGAVAGVSAARAALATHGVQGQVALQAGRLTVSTQGRSQTLFLSLIGVDHFDVSAQATAQLVRT